MASRSDETNWRSDDNRSPAGSSNNRFYRTPLAGGDGANKSRREPLSPTLPEKYAFPSRVSAQYLLGKLMHANMPFSTQLRTLTQEIILPTEDLHHRGLIVRNLQLDLQEVFQGARLRLFGSSANGIGTRGSDMDAIAVLPKPPPLKLSEMDDLLSPPVGHLRFEDLRKMKRPLEPKYVALLTHADLVVLLRKFLIMKYWPTFSERQSCEFSNIVAIHGARIPIVRLVYKSGLEVDISLSHDEHPLSLCNTGLLLLLASMDVRFKMMCIVLRRWQEEHYLTKGHGGLNNYALTLLVMHYLQHNDAYVAQNDEKKPVVLPALGDLAKKVASIDAALHAANVNHAEIPPFNAGGVNPVLYDRESWTEVVNHSDMWRTENRQSMPELLCGFFRYYTRHVPLLSNVIRTHIGESVNTVEFFRRSWQAYLHDKRSEALLGADGAAAAEPVNDASDSQDDPFNVPRTNALYVYDPFLPTYNTAKNLSVSKAVELHAKLTAAARIFDEVGERSTLSLCTLLGLEESVAMHAATVAEAAKAAADAAAAAAAPADPAKIVQETIEREENRYRHQQLDYQQKQVEYDADEFVWSFTLTLGYLKKRSLVEALYTEPSVGKAIAKHLQAACKFVLAVLRDVYCFDTIKMRKEGTVDDDNYTELNEFLTQNKNRDVDAGSAIKTYYNVMSLMPILRGRPESNKLPEAASSGELASAGKTSDKACGEVSPENCVSDKKKSPPANGNDPAEYAENNSMFEELVGLRRLLHVECMGSQALWLPSVRSSKALAGPAAALADNNPNNKKDVKVDRPLTTKEKAFDREVQITEATKHCLVQSLLAHVKVQVKVEVMSNFDTLLVQVSSLNNGGGIDKDNLKQTVPPASSKQSGKLEELARHLRMLCFDFVV